MKNGFGIRLFQMWISRIICISLCGNAFADNTNTCTDGTCIDTRTNLMWQEIMPEGVFPYVELDETRSIINDVFPAEKYCEDLILGPAAAPYTDWRLPAPKEAMTIVDYIHPPIALPDVLPDASGVTSRLDTRIFPNLQAQPKAEQVKMWTHRSIRRAAGVAIVVRDTFVVDLQTGQMHPTGYTKTDNSQGGTIPNRFAVRCVRDL